MTKKITAILLTLFCIFTLVPGALAAEDPTRREVYLHARGENPTVTENSSTMYLYEKDNLYLAIDDPNKCTVTNGIPEEPQYALNGYTVKFCFDSNYFKYAAENTGAPITYDLPDQNLSQGSSGSENVGGTNVPNTPTSVGYYVYKHGSGTTRYGNKTYKTAYITVFFSGQYLPEKTEEGWYNLCALPLEPIKKGTTDVYIETGSADEFSLELFAKDVSEDYAPTFDYAAVNGGFHTINIQDRNRPSAPIPDPPAGSYTAAQQITLSGESGCRFYYSTDGSDPTEPYLPGDTITIPRSLTLKVRAERIADGKWSDIISHDYKIIPAAPLLFDSARNLIPNTYSEESAYEVLVSDKSPYGGIDDEHEIYYTFSGGALPADAVDSGNAAESFVKVLKASPRLQVTEACTVRLFTRNVVTGEISDIAVYNLSIAPTPVTAVPASGIFSGKIDVELSTRSANARIFYTTNQSDPITNGLLYNGPITLTADTTIRAVAELDGTYSAVTSFWYLFSHQDDYGVQAFHPSGVYAGSVKVTLTPNNPEFSVEYSTDGGETWKPVTGVLTVDRDTQILARAVDTEGNAGDAYTFVYKIKPLPPIFAPDSTQFTSADIVSIYSPERTNDNTDRYLLFYTTDGSDPTMSRTRVQADAVTDAAEVQITDYTVIRAVIQKDNTTYSDVVTHSYDIVSQRPARPITTLLPGRYTYEIDRTVDYSTRFMPVPGGVEIYYTIQTGGTFCADPVPNTEGTYHYDGTPIPVLGKTIIKAVAVGGFGGKSDIGIFEYTVTPAAPVAAPSAAIDGDTLPRVPVKAVAGSKVTYSVNGFENTFVTDDGEFYIDTETGTAYPDENGGTPLGTPGTLSGGDSATLIIKSELDGVESPENTYTYSLSDGAVAPPYASHETGVYKEIDRDGKGSLLLVTAASLNEGDTIEYRLGNSGTWKPYDGMPISITGNTVLQLRSTKNGVESDVRSYVYNFVPLPPVITLEAGRYAADPTPETYITLDFARVPKPYDKYSIFYCRNGDNGDFRLTWNNETKIDIDHTLSLKAYVKNDLTGEVSTNTVHYYIIEKESANGSVYVASPYNVRRISAHLLNTGSYAEGIKLFSDNKNADISYYYSYTKTTGDSLTTNDFIYNNAAPIFVNAMMDDITIIAKLLDESDTEIPGSESVFYIDFVHLEIPKPSLEAENKVEFSRETKYTIINDYPQDENSILYYTTDGSDPSDPENTARKVYKGETFSLSGDITLKTVYFSACGTCAACKDNRKADCWDGVYGQVGTFRYTVPSRTGGGSGGGGEYSGTSRRYTHDIFGNEHPTHIGYINGYPDGSVKPEGDITREEIAAVLYRITNHDYEAPFVATGDAFPDVTSERWSSHDIEYMADKAIIQGYPDGEFKPTRNLTRAEFAALISRFAKIVAAGYENSFPDVSQAHWAYNEILSLAHSGFMTGYEDGTFRPEDNISRAEVMTVINKLLGRKPLESYVKSLEFNPYNDLYPETWYYVTVLEATITHNYWLNIDGYEHKWEDWK